jgi:hypothetical protein
MVTLANNQAVAQSETLRVYSPDGEYADQDLILCAEAERPDLPTAMLQAQFIRYGSIVYRFQTPEELGEALYAIDPSSTHDAVALYKEELARDAARDAGVLSPTDPVPAPDSPVEETPVPDNNDQEADTQFFKEQAAEETASSTATSTDASGGGEVLGEATSTPSFPEDASSTPALPEDVATSTPPVPDIVPDATSTPDLGTMSSTTPEVPAPAVDLSSTTPE